MQTIGPYLPLQVLGTCQVGSVWSAADQANNQVTVAVLDADAVRDDPGLRDAFSQAASSLEQSGVLSVLASDHQARAPWVACAGADPATLAQIFATMGISYQPVAGYGAAPGGVVPGAAAGGEVSGQVDAAAVTEPMSMPPGAPAFPPQPPAPPAPPAPPYPGAVPAQAPGFPSPPPAVPPPPPPPPAAPPAPHPAPPPPVTSAPPAADPPGNPWPAQPYDLAPVSPFLAAPRPAGRRRIALLIAMAVLTVVVLGGGAGAIAYMVRPESPAPTPTAGPTTALPTVAPEPAAPGVEPPLDGEWPADWPTFADDEAVPAPGLAGLEFTFQVPQGWNCIQVSETDGLNHHTCGPGGDDRRAGGDLIVRDCPDPCDAERRVEMRRAEEAWGLQWVRDGWYWSWAEGHEIEDQERYGLVIVGYWRTSDESRLERQLVFRMSAPVEQADDIRMIAQSVRDEIR